MSTGIWSAASGATGQSFALDVSANNIANATTPWFKADRAVFRQELSRAVQSLGSRSMRYSVVRSTAPNLEVGNIVRTARPMDVALRDPESVLVVSTPQGERYTRAGSVQIQSNGNLVTREGYAFLGPDKKPLRVATDGARVEIGRDGSINVDGIASGSRLLTLKFPPGTLDKDGNVLLKARPGAPPPVPVDADLEPEALEMSNASPVTSMTSLVTASRQFEMLTKVIEAFSSVDHKAATDLMSRR